MRIHSDVSPTQILLLHTDFVQTVKNWLAEVRLGSGRDGFVANDFFFCEKGECGRRGSIGYEWTTRRVSLVWTYQKPHTSHQQGFSGRSLICIANGHTNNTHPQTNWRRIPSHAQQKANEHKKINEMNKKECMERDTKKKKWWWFAKENALRGWACQTIPFSGWYSPESQINTKIN